MKKRYIKPQTSVIVQQTERPLLSGSDDGGNKYGAKPWTPVGDNWRDDEQDNAPWAKQKNVWNE